VLCTSSACYVFVLVCIFTFLFIVYNAFNVIFSLHNNNNDNNNNNKCHSLCGSEVTGKIKRSRGGHVPQCPVADDANGYYHQSTNQSISLYQQTSSDKALYCVCVSSRLSVLIKSCKLVLYFLQELSLLREAIFPYLLCSAAHKGGTETMERLRQAVGDLAVDLSACEFFTA